MQTHELTRIDEGVRAAAEVEADAAARRAGVSVLLALDQQWLSAAEALFTRIWGAEPPVPSDLMRALTHSGNYVAVALAEGSVLGAAVAFRSDREGLLHSHISGVDATARNRGVGLALKLHQRAWALEHGLRRIEWTFDPLVARNAHVNLSRLGARSQDYLPDFYGSMNDDLNDGDASDRLLARWSLEQPTPPVAHSDSPLTRPAASVLLGMAADGAPLPGSIPATAPRCYVQVPQDIVRLRRNQARLATSWRRAVREAFELAFAEGWQAIGCSHDGWYELDRPTQRSTNP